MQNNNTGNVEVKPDSLARRKEPLNGIIHIKYIQKKRQREKGNRIDYTKTREV